MTALGTVPCAATKGTNVTNPVTSVDTYLAAYGETAPLRRKELITSCFAVDATIADPPLDAAGHDGIDDMFATVQQQFPDHMFRRVSDVDTHHGSARYEWELVAGDGSVSVAGTDFVRFGSDGLLVDVVGFFGPTSPLDESALPG